MIDASIRQIVRQRAAACCEYCRLPETATEVPFHIEHIIASQHRLDDSVQNLALACDRCNLHKGPNLTSIDPQTDAIVRLFDPRQDHWLDHFAIDEADIVGLTPAGRATVKLLQMNAPRRRELRRRLIEQGQF